MGYLSQKKRHARESRFLFAATIVFCVLTIVAFLPENIMGIKGWLFQIYLLNLLIFIYTLVIRRFLYATFLTIFLILNYFQIATAAQVFFDTDVRSANEFSVVYDPQDVLKVSSAEVLRQGHLVLNEKNVAPFAAIDKSGHIFTLIRVDLRQSSIRDRNIALRQLQNFISEQDEPVVVFGDFGLPAWSHEIKQFLEATRLEVKNHLLFTDHGCRFNLLRAPGFYVLSFQNVGIEDIEVSPALNNQSYPQIAIRLGFY
mgnify:FL=1